MTASRLTLFDSHVHLDRLPDHWSVPAMLQAARRCEVGGWLIPGVRRTGWRGLISLAEEHPDVWAAPGLHPLAADHWNGQARHELESLLGHERVLAVGEIGLDRMLEISLAQQEKAFLEQLELASRHHKPVLIHCRGAWGRVVDILRESKLPAGGILHAFGGSLEVARQGFELGYLVSFGGPLTYPNARKRVEVLQGLPKEAIVLETDAPDLPPHPHRQQPNRPEWLTLVAERVAELRGWSPQETARITTDNISRIFQWPRRDRVE